MTSASEEWPQPTTLRSVADQGSPAVGSGAAIRISPSLRLEMVAFGCGTLHVKLWFDDANNHRRGVWRCDDFPPCSYLLQSLRGAPRDRATAPARLSRRPRH